jgi:LmbE family N-acetylglucosaminyl deacetylase
VLGDRLNWPWGAAECARRRRSRGGAAHGRSAHVRQPLRRSAGLLVAGLLLALALAAAGPATPAAGPVLVLVAHPDDEALGMAGIIASSRAAGRPVYVAVVTNGDSAGGSQSGFCGAASGASAAAARVGLLRDKETVAAMAVLDVPWSASLAASRVFFLGYPDAALTTIAQASTPWSGDRTGLHRTYAEDGDGSSGTCNGDFRFLVSGQHSPLSASALAADFDALLTTVKPTDLYTHAEVDSLGDHKEVYRQVVASLRRTTLAPRLHATLIHPEDASACLQEWPNPSLASVGGNVQARFTPTIDFAAPPKPSCVGSTTLSWGSWGPPNEWVEVPASMQATSEASNLKWQALSKYASQLSCPNACSYFRAFVKRREFFWTSSPRPTARVTAPVDVSLPRRRLTIGGGPVRISASGKGRIWLGCAKVGPNCRGRLTVYRTAVLHSPPAPTRKRRILVGSGAFRLRAGSAYAANLELNTDSLRRLTHRGAMRAHVIAAPADRRPTVSRSIRLVLVRAAQG